MVQEPPRFGEELRRRRLAADLTLTGLARLVHYSKGHLSKVERGIKMPSRQLARLCDVALGAEGALAALFSEKSSGTGATIGMDGDEEVWLMQLSADDDSWFGPVSRRRAVAAGAISIAGMSISWPGSSASVEDPTYLGIHRSLFDHYRQLGQVVDSRLLLPVLIAQTHTLRELSTRAGPRIRDVLLMLASQYAEYIGWMVQEAGNEQAALWWTQHAADLAAAGGDPHLAVYGLVRRALVTLYGGDAEQTIEMAQRAQSGKVPARIRGLAALREAQGHALAGAYDSSMRSLERARVLLARRTADSDGPVIGTTNLADPAEMIKGWCLHDLGRPQTAAEIIDIQLAQLPLRALRARVRYGVRSAVAHAAAGEVEHACHLTAPLLDSAITLRSATIATDLRNLGRTLSRHPRNASVRELAPKLGTALQTGIP